MDQFVEFISSRRRAHGECEAAVVRICSVELDFWDSDPQNFSQEACDELQRIQGGGLEIFSHNDLSRSIGCDIKAFYTRCIQSKDAL